MPDTPVRSSWEENAFDAAVRGTKKAFADPVGTVAPIIVFALWVSGAMVPLLTIAELLIEALMFERLEVLVLWKLGVLPVVVPALAQFLKPSLRPMFLALTVGTTLLAFVTPRRLYRRNLKKSGHKPYWLARHYWTTNVIALWPYVWERVHNKVQHPTHESRPVLDSTGEKAPRLSWIPDTSHWPAFSVDISVHAHWPYASFKRDQPFMARAYRDKVWRVELEEPEESHHLAKLWFITKEPKPVKLNKGLHLPPTGNEARSVEVVAETIERCEKDGVRPDQETSSGLHVAFGRTITFGLVTADVGSYHTLNSGNTRTGKTKFVRTLLTQVALNREAGMLLIDPHTQFNGFDARLSVAKLSETDDFDWAMKYMWRVYEYRRKLVERAIACGFITENASWQPILGPWLICGCDEFLEFHKSLSKEIAEWFSRLQVMMLKYGISLITSSGLVLNKTTNKDVDDGAQIFRNFTFKVTGKQADENTIAIALGLKEESPHVKLDEWINDTWAGAVNADVDGVRKGFCRFQPYEPLDAEEVRLLLSDANVKALPLEEYFGVAA